MNETLNQIMIKAIESNGGKMVVRGALEYETPVEWAFWTVLHENQKGTQ